MRAAEHQLFRSAVEFLAAGGGYVGFRRLRGEHDPLRTANTLEHRGVAARVAVDSDPEIDFVGKCSARNLAISPRMESAFRRSRF